MKKLSKTETFEGIAEYLFHHCNEPFDLVQYLCENNAEKIYEEWEPFIREQAELLLPE